jgi:hypothetical protein
VEIEEQKKRMAQYHAERTESLEEHIIAQRVEEFTEKAMQAR